MQAIATTSLPQHILHTPGQRPGPMCHEYGIPGYGDPSYGVAVVGIAPGMNEAEKTHMPFTGPSGDLLNACLKFAGWPRDKIYATNVICWWNNAPNEAEIEACRPRLVRELRWASPKLIVTCGEIANTAIMGAKRRRGSRGSITWSDYWQAYVLDTHHPSYALQAQSQNVVQDIIRDLSKIKRVLEWPTGAEHTRVEYRAAHSLEEAQYMLNTLPRDRPVTLDIETSNPDVEAIDAYTDQLLCFSVSFTMGTGKHEHEVNWVFPTEILPVCVRTGTHAQAYRTHGTCTDCTLSRTVFDWPLDRQWAFQAGQFDIGALAVYFGVTLPLVDDTMLMSVCCDERPGNHGLKQNAREYLGAGWYEEKVKPFYKGKMHLLPPDELYHYNAKDAAYTRRLMPVFTEGMQADQTEGLYKNLLVPAMRTFIQMQVRGIAVDQARLQQLAYEVWFPRYIKTYRDLQLEANDIGWPTDDINFNSSPQMQRFFYDVLGLEPTKFTKGGKPSVDKETLDKMDHPFAAKLRAFRTLDTTIDYVLAVYQHLKWDGLLHPSAFVSTTRTGRTSYRDPAMQTIPKAYTVGEDYARLREIVVPHNTYTHEIIEADYNQIEVWLAWAFSRDNVLHQHLLSGDVHSATAEGAFNTKRELHTPERWDEMRQNAKKIRFGIQYGEGAEKLATPPPVGIGGTRADAQRFINNFKRTYPIYTAWMVTIQRQMQREGYLRTPSGRVMRFPIVLDHKALRQAINFPIQGTASDYNLYAMIHLEHPDFNARLRALNSWVILNIHDCLVVESDRRYRSEVIALIREVMERSPFDGFPSIKVEVKVGPSLGAVEKLDKVKKV